MAVLESRVTEKGQVTIPAEVRRLLGIKPRDTVRFEIHDGSVLLRPTTSKIDALFGAVEPRSRPEDFQAIREEVEQRIADEVVAEG